MNMLPQIVFLFEVENRGSGSSLTTNIHLPSSQLLLWTVVLIPHVCSTLWPKWTKTTLKSPFLFKEPPIPQISYIWQKSSLHGPYESRICDFYAHQLVFTVENCCYRQNSSEKPIGISWTSDSLAALDKIYCNMSSEEGHYATCEPQIAKWDTMCSTHNKTTWCLVLNPQCNQSWRGFQDSTPGQNGVLSWPLLHEPKSVQFANFLERLQLRTLWYMKGFKMSLLAGLWYFSFWVEARLSSVARIWIWRRSSQKAALG